MVVCNNRGFLVIKTKFNDQFDLIQKFRGLDNGSVYYNNPVDFMESGLMYKGKSDYWHIDIPFAINTDEAVPAFVNDGFIGGNHGCYCAVEVYVPAHGITFENIGSIWNDECGISFTLVQVYDEDYLLFISENIGESTDNYAFITEISGKLFSTDNFSGKIVIFPTEQKRADLRRAIRNKNKRVVAFVNGQERNFRGEIECDYVEIHEDYEIINPATVANDLRRLRPKNGYHYQPDLADYGNSMISCSLIYRIIDDGTVFTIFDYKKLMNVKFTRFMGIMFQEKLDVYGGGIWRYFPKILPFKTKEGQFDFSTPCCITDGLFPKDVHLKRENFNDNCSPCERVVDYFCDKEGRTRLAFACGFLPIYDGALEIRNERVSNVLHLKNTRKYYPTFIDGNVERVKGVAYKKYFIPLQNKCSFYEIEFDGVKYIYVDTFKNGLINIPYSGEVTVMEKSDGISYIIEDGCIKISGEKGFVAFSVTF